VLSKRPVLGSRPVCYALFKELEKSIQCYECNMWVSEFRIFYEECTPCMLVQGFVLWWTMLAWYSDTSLEGKKSRS